MYQGNNQQREEPPKESMEDKMVRMFSELRHDVTNMRQEWKQDLRQEISTIRQEVSNLRQENNASLRHLETQVAQNSKALAERPQGTLPSTTVNNPRERVQAVTLRSGKELPEPTLKKNTISKNPIEEEKIEEIIEVDKEQEKETSPSPSSPKATQSRDKGKEKKFYKWDASIEHVRKAFQAQAGIRYTDMVSKFKSNRTSTGKPACIHEDTWRIWEAYWDRPDVKAKSEQQRKNRMSEVAGPGTGCSRHTGGSRSAIEHYHKLRDELQKESNLFECFEHMHKKKNGAFVDERSKKIAEEIQARHDAATQEVEGSTEPPVINMSQLYVDVVGGVKKQRIYGLGTKASSFINSNSCSSSATSQFHQDTMKEMLDTMRLRRNGIIPTTSTPQPPTTEGHSVNSNDEDLGDD
nr:uncharacterized protein LOC109146588 [Ipomoea trifida]